jgi:hypothetical protein
MGMLRLSQVPAQARPFSAILTTLGLLVRKVKVVVRGDLLAFRAEALNCRELPRSMDAVGDGASLTTAGTPKPGVGGTLLPQPGKMANSVAASTPDKIVPTLLINPPRPAICVPDESQCFTGERSV